MIDAKKRRKKSTSIDDLKKKKTLIQLGIQRAYLSKVPM